MNPENVRIIEEFVNSPEAVAIVTDQWEWEALMAKLKPQLVEPLSEAHEESLERDLRDWWKNGNFRIWGENEINSFGVAKWELGEADFWDWAVRNGQ